MRELATGAVEMRTLTLPSLASLMMPPSRAAIAENLPTTTFMVAVPVTRLVAIGAVIPPRGEPSALQTTSLRKS